MQTKPRMGKQHSRVFLQFRERPQAHFCLQIPTLYRHNYVRRFDRFEVHAATADLHPGDRITLRVQYREDVTETKEKFQRGKLDDVSLLAQPLLWSEGTDLIRR